MSADLDGRDHCFKYLDSEDFPAAYAAMHSYTYEVAPVGTSGWYLPSTGQSYNICVKLGKAPDTHTAYYWGGISYQVADSLNSKMKVVGTNNYMPFNYNSEAYWLSNEYTASNAMNLLFYPGGNYKYNMYWGDNEAKSSSYYVRPVIAF